MASNSVNQVLGMWMPGTFEWIVIAIVALLLFGRRLPEIARGMGKSLVEFKKGIAEASSLKDEVTKEADNLKREIVNEVKDAAGVDDLMD